MLRFTSIVLAPLLLFQSLQISIADLIQVDELLEHARYHEEEFGDNFITFISKHYGSLKEDHAKKHSEEKPQHEQLPFQQLSHFTGLQVVILRNLDLYFGTPSDVPAGEKIQFYYYLSDYSGFQSGIFQPPKQV
ncbi:MAG: hypothetical protein RLZZ241_2072 [Bacteroidota bacterium]|jgi:hypothetical protein